MLDYTITQEKKLIVLKPIIVSTSHIITTTVTNIVTEVLPLPNMDIVDDNVIVNNNDNNHDKNTNLEIEQTSELEIVTTVN